jgi:hypothetical protein
LFKKRYSRIKRKGIASMLVCINIYIYYIYYVCVSRCLAVQEGVLLVALLVAVFVTLVALAVALLVAIPTSRFGSSLIVHLHKIALQVCCANALTPAVRYRIISAFIHRVGFIQLG